MWLEIYSNEKFDFEFLSELKVVKKTFIFYFYSNKYSYYSIYFVPIRTFIFGSVSNLKVNLY